ncbi:MAG: hypothetical protein K1X94_21980 [Sandaracinaceae bacterium]|nr:hypothetical protein [Sandaracinaceae bacterium]
MEDGRHRGERPVLPWQTRRSASTWWESMVRVVVSPAEAARAIQPTGPLAPAFAFAAVAFALHAAGSTSLLLLVAWRHAAETASRFGPDNPVASAMLAVHVGARPFTAQAA